jgi:hypothetical protein
MSHSGAKALQMMIDHNKGKCMKKKTTKKKPVVTKKASKAIRDRINCGMPLRIPKNDNSPKLKYGTVEVIAGRHKGKIGYYDDEEYTDSGAERAVVYFEFPFVTDWVMIKHEHLVNTKKKNPALELMRTHNRKECIFLGVPLKG